MDLLLTSLTDCSHRIEERELKVKLGKLSNSSDPKLGRTLSSTARSKQTTSRDFP